MKQQLKKQATGVMAVTALLFASSCNSSKTEVQPTQEGTHIEFSVKPAETFTKTGRSAWMAGDEIGIFMLPSGTTSVISAAGNKQHITSDGSTFLPVGDNKLYYPQDGSSVDFIAYYPYVENLTDGITYPINVADQTQNIDLLYSSDATNKSKTTTGNVALTFRHMLSRIEIEVVPGSGVTASMLSNMGVSILGMNTAGSFHLGNQTLGITNSPAKINTLSLGGNKFEAIVIPTNMTSGQLKMEFKLANDETFNWISNTADQFESGKVYNYKMTLQYSGISGFSCTITPWGSGTPKEYTVE